MQADFAADGALTAITTGGYTRLVAHNTNTSGRTLVDGCTTSPKNAQPVVNYSSATRVLCVTRECTRPPPENQVVVATDCYGPGLAGNNSMEWTTTVSSAAPGLFTAPIRRGLVFTRPVQEQRRLPAATAGEEESVWAAWDEHPGDTGTAAALSPFLLTPVPQSTLANTVWWLGGLLSAPGDGCNKPKKHSPIPCTAAYGFRSSKLSVPVVASFPPSSSSAAPASSSFLNAADTAKVGLVFLLNLDDFLSTELSLAADVNTATRTAGLTFGYQAYRLGGTGTAPLILRADVAAIESDARAALGYVANRHRTFFEPNVTSARTSVSGTGWYSRCGPGVGGCDTVATNATYASELEEIAFKYATRARAGCT